MHSELHHNVAQSPLPEWARPVRVQAEKTTPPTLSQQTNKGRLLHTEAHVLAEHNHVVVRSA